MFPFQYNSSLASCFLKVALPLLISFAATGWCAFAINPQEDSKVDFEARVRPVLNQRCTRCHGPNKQEAGLRLDSKTWAMKGGLEGKVIVPSESLSSSLYQRIASADPDVRMPPGSEPLNAEETLAIKNWIDQGAVWEETALDRDADLGVHADAERNRRLAHWAWQPITRPPLPQTRNSDWPLNAVDTFVLAELEAHQLQPAPRASKSVLIRRLAFDLMGIPPTSGEIDAFLNDTSSDAYAKLVDRYLASPRYGERWARHWLDIAHYADTHGFERDQKREHAWRYRDYVIDAFNRDKPYGRFLLEQIAGDALDPPNAEATIATGFLAAGPWDFVGQAETPSPVIKRLARADDLDDMVTQVMTAACAITLNCARCHDHKLDPISQREYYAMWAAFAGAKRANRIVDPAEAESLARRKEQLQSNLDALRNEIFSLEKKGLDLADIVGGGNGLGTGKRGTGIHLMTGKPQLEKLGFLEGITPNRFQEVEGDYIDGVLIPEGSPEEGIVISSSGLRTIRIPPSNGKGWDAVRHGPVNSQGSTQIGAIDFQSEGHSLLGLHANSAITFDLDPFRKTLGTPQLQLHCELGYGGRPEPYAGQAADARVLLDGEIAFLAEQLNPKTARLVIALPIPESARFLTLVSTDAGNDIGFDQVFFGDPRITGATVELNEQEKAKLADLRGHFDRIQKELRSLPAPAQVFAIQSESPPEVFVLRRGSPEDPIESVLAGSVQCLSPDRAERSMDAPTDPLRRLNVAQWIVDETHPTTRRVIVNRLWQHHFGMGLVETPSDFGLGGALPSHPALLDWLATQLLDRGDSLKELHRLICNSATYQQSSTRNHPRAEQVDQNNRWLWRQNARRIDAETLRDRVLIATHSCNFAMHGPGFQDFEYQEEYAPIYDYTPSDREDLHRRSIYRFIVRTTPHPFLTPLDCPNPANLSPTRNVTTTAVQSLALWNNHFILRQSHLLAEEIRRNESSLEEQVDAAFQAILCRAPSKLERSSALRLLETQKLEELCRALLNSNEFVVVD